MDRLAIPAMVAINFVEMSGPWMTLSPGQSPTAGAYSLVRSAS
jgi:hypothetical protein